MLRKLEKRRNTSFIRTCKTFSHFFSRTFVQTFLNFLIIFSKIYPELSEIFSTFFVSLTIFFLECNRGRGEGGGQLPSSKATPCSLSTFVPFAHYQHLSPCSWATFVLVLQRTICPYSKNCPLETLSQPYSIICFIYWRLDTKWLTSGGKI